MMRLFVSVVGLSCALSVALAWGADAGKTTKKDADKKDARHFQYIDLQTKSNHKLKDQFHGNTNPGNDLASLPVGEQTLAEVKFKIGEGYLQLGSMRLTEQTDKIEGIKVDKSFAKLHILQATGWATDDDTIIGEYTVTWEDDTSVTIPIVYGKDVRDWWFGEEDPEPSRGKVAWKGENEACKRASKGIRLYVTTWENTKPDKKVKTIDLSTTKETMCAPFCVAMTVE
jgi:hypothetical protein